MSFGRENDIVYAINRGTHGVEALTPVASVQVNIRRFLRIFQAQILFVRSDFKLNRDKVRWAYPHLTNSPTTSA